jgi:hypothetical protein
METAKNRQDDLTPTGQRAVAIAVAIVKKIMEEREAKEAEMLAAIKTDTGKLIEMEVKRENALKRAVMQFLTGIGWIEK